MQPSTNRGRIVSVKRNGNTYYSYIRTYRVKIDQKKTGLTRGTGKSRVVTESHYLGTAENILEKLIHDKPAKIYTKHFGLPCALWKMAQDIDLVNIVNRVVNKQKRKRKVSLGEYIVIAAINQVGHCSSKRSLGRWYGNTALPRITGISKDQLTSQHFWNAFDEILSEKELQKKKLERGIPPASKLEFEELEKILDDSQIEQIEMQLWKIIGEKFNLSLDVILYDGTNFYTFIDERTPTNIAQRGKNKQKRNDKRQVGLTLAVLRQWGIPIFHKVYGGQTNEQCLFPTAVTTLVERYSQVAKSVEKLILVFDQGSNSKEHFKSLEGKVHFIGSLSPSDYKNLAAIPVSKYDKEYDGTKFYQTKMQIYSRESLVLLTYNPKQQYKERISFNKQLDRVQNSLNARIKKLSTGDLDELKKEIQRSLGNQKIFSSKASRYLEIKDHINGSGIRSLKIIRNRVQVTKKRQTFGKRIIFTDMVDEQPEKILYEYRGKQTVEESFKALKDRQYVSLWPMYHWTDTKIKLHAFVTVLALLLVKLIEYQVRSKGIEISGRALVNELQDISESLLVYNSKEAEQKICELNTNQKEIFKILGLEPFC